MARRLPKWISSGSGRCKSGLAPDPDERRLSRMLISRSKVNVICRSPRSWWPTGSGFDDVSSGMGNIWYVYGSFHHGPRKSGENELPKINEPGTGRFACIQSGPDAVPSTDFRGLQCLFAPLPHGHLILIALASINVQSVQGRTILVLDKMPQQLTRAADAEVRIGENPIFSGFPVMTHDIGDLLDGIVDLNLTKPRAGASFTASRRSLQAVAEERFFPEDPDDDFRGMMHISWRNSTNEPQKGHGLVFFQAEKRQLASRAHDCYRNILLERK